MLIVDKFISIALGILSTTYGYGEIMCGDIDNPKECSKGALTASGEVFDPNMPTMAVFSPTKMRMGSIVIYVKLRKVGKCEYIRVNDKGNPRYIGSRGFDLTPAAVRLLGGHATPYWSGIIEPCIEPEEFTCNIKSEIESELKGFSSFLEKVK